MNSNRPKSARSALEVALTDGVCLPVGIITALLVARSLGPELRGLLSYLMLLDSFVMPIAMLGIGNAVIYFTSSKEHPIERAFWPVLLTAMAHGVATSLLFSLLWKTGCLGPNAEKIPESLCWIALGISPIRFGNLMLSRILIGSANYRMLNLKTFTSSVVGGVAAATAVCVYGLGLPGAVITSAAVAALEFMIALTYMLIRVRPSWTFAPEYLKETYRYGLKAWVGNLASRSNLRLDQMMLAGGSAEALGWYSMATRISELVWVFPDALAGVLFNRITAIKSEPERVKLTAQVHRAVFLILVPAAVLGGIAGFWVIPLILGQEYRMTAVLVPVLLPGAVGFVSFKILTKYFGATKQPGVASQIQVVGLVFGLACYAIMIWFWGVVGAGIASTLTYCVTSAAGFYFVRSSAPHWLKDFFGVSRQDLGWLLGQLRGVRKRKSSTSVQNEAAPPTAP